jgi:hypothetical protein
MFTMKLLLTLIILLICSRASVEAQQLSNGAFAQHHWVVNVGEGIVPIYYNGADNNVRHLSPSLSVDYMITHKLGIGQISAGLVLSYAHEDLFTHTVEPNGENYNFDDTYTSVLIGVRSAYHFIVPVKGLDPYAGVLLADISPTYPTMIGGRLPNQQTITGGIYAGLHYFFLHWLGVFCEVGKNGFSVGTLGLSLKM